MAQGLRLPSPRNESLAFHVEASRNSGVALAGPYQEDHAMLGYTLGRPYLWKPQVLRSAASVVYNPKP